VPVVSGGGGGAASALIAGATSITSGDVTTGSTTFVALTGVTVTVVLVGPHRVMLTLSGSYSNTAAGNGNYFDFTVDGTRQGGSEGLFPSYCPGINYKAPANMTFITAALTAASHTFAVQWRVSAGTGTFYASATSPAIISAVELLAA
jgi:hypothetical protein